MRDLPELPIGQVLPAVLAALESHGCTVIEAPPGAGKSTVVPLALLAAHWRADQRIIVLEPRRVAARAVARRMAEILGEDAGQTVGYRTRLQSQVGPATRIEVVTDGIFTRMLQHDPALEGTACVVFDEFHERGLQSDLGLALCLDARRHLRESLRLVVMSATLESGPLLKLLENAQVISTAGRSFDVETRFVPLTRDARTTVGELERRMAGVTVRALDENAGDALLFLPGTAEIRRTANLLAATLTAGDTRILPLHGQLSAAEQDAALRPDESGRRKVILATSIAETSLTIPGVRIVIDSGLERHQRFDPNSGMSRLETRSISRASADQRRGRAGRTAPGVCYRLWSESEHESLASQASPEIVEADLAPLALELACWGARDPLTLSWLDPPPSGPLAQARDQLQRLEAIDAAGRPTALGRQMSTLGLHPRLAHMVLRGQQLGRQGLACELAALLSERDPLKSRGALRNPDLRLRIEMLHGATAPAGFEADRAALTRIRQLAAQIERRLRPSSAAARRRTGTHRESASAGLLLAMAYPDRIGRRRRSQPGHYLLSGGRGAMFPQAAALAGSEFIVVASLDDVEREARIHLALPVDLFDLETHVSPLIETESEIAWNDREHCVVARKLRRLGKLTLTESRLVAVDPEAVLAAMLTGIRSMGLGCLPWTEELEERRARLAFARAMSSQSRYDWPDTGDDRLLETLESWLGPWLDGVTRRDQLVRIDLHCAFENLADWNSWKRLDEFAPTHLAVPSGSRVRLDYSSGQPKLSVRLQEVFGLMESPRIGDRQVAVTMELLSPARRPVQVTRDLASFWADGYAEVRKELKGRYPKHYWPEDPMQAVATRRLRPPEA